MLQIFKYYFFIFIIWGSCCSNICNCYSSFSSYACITIITSFDLNIKIFKFNFPISVICFTQFIIYFKSIFCSKFRWLIWCIVFFDTVLLNCYINLISSIFFCLSSEDIYLSLGISLSFSFLIVSKLFCCESFETFVILLSILLLIKSPIASAVF